MLHDIYAFMALWTPCQHFMPRIPALMLFLGGAHQCELRACMHPAYKLCMLSLEFRFGQ